MNIKLPFSEHPFVQFMSAFVTLICMMYGYLYSDYCSDFWKYKVFKYGEHHQKINSQTKESELLLELNKVLYKCDSLELKYDVKKPSKWIPIPWPDLYNNYVYVFLVNMTKGRTHVHDIRKLHEKKEATGTLSFPKEAITDETPLLVSIDNERYLLNNSEIGRKEIYFLALEKEDEELEKEYEEGDVNSFYKELKEKKSFFFSFNLYNGGECDEIEPVLDININYIDALDNIYSLTKGKKLIYTDNLKISFSSKQDGYVYIFHTDETNNVNDLISNSNISSEVKANNDYLLDISEKDFEFGKQNIYFFWFKQPNQKLIGNPNKEVINNVCIDNKKCINIDFVANLN